MTQTPDLDRLTAYADELVDVHDRLRDQLDAVRADVDAYLDGGTGPPTRTIREHCLAFCTALSAHHSEEDDGVFPVLAQRMPEIRDVLHQLGRDHRAVAAMLASLEDVVRRLAQTATATDRRRLLGDLDGLSAVLESHFRHEERTLLNAVAVAASR